MSLLPLLMALKSTVSSISFVASADANNTSITIPASAQAGDVAILADGAANTTATIPTSVTPTGWTLANSESYSYTGYDSIRTNVSYKVLDAGDPGASISGMTGGSTSQKAMVVFRPDVSLTALVAGTVAHGNDISGSQINANVTCSSVAAPLVVIAVYRISPGSGAPTFTFSPGKSSAVDRIENTVVALRLAYVIFNSSPQNQTINEYGPGVTSTIQGFYLKFV